LHQARGELIPECGGNIVFEGVEDLGFEHSDGGAGGNSGEDGEFVGFDEDLVDFGLDVGWLGWVGGT
jgi:hypothetical protein